MSSFSTTAPGMASCVESNGIVLSTVTDSLEEPIFNGMSNRARWPISTGIPEGNLSTHARYRPACTIRHSVEDRLLERIRNGGKHYPITLHAGRHAWRSGGK